MRYENNTKQCDRALTKTRVSKRHTPAAPQRPYRVSLNQAKLCGDHLTPHVRRVAHVQEGRAKKGIIPVENCNCNSTER